MCGEKLCAKTICDCELGSPPRVRGKAIPEVLLFGYDRITPACAGKSCTASSASASDEDHPRVCGEKFSPPTFPVRPHGSPPRVRGKAAFFSFFVQRCGITPACAGKSIAAAGIPRWWEDHPRVCGEKSGRRSMDTSLVGSPPRVRGKGKHHAHDLQSRRITPACAGKRDDHLWKFLDIKDPPRVCGEKYAVS